VLGVNNRPAREVWVLFHTEKQKECFSLPEMPYVLPGDVITIVLGETLDYEFDVEGDRLVRPRRVMHGAHPERTLSLEMTQKDELVGTLLMLRSGLPGIVTAGVGMQVARDTSLRQTTVLPLQTGISAYEHWPHPLIQIRMRAFHLSAT
jgi:hypothetical protein